MSPQELAGTRFRALHDQREPFVLANAGDCGTARLLEQAGFKALATSSAAAAFSMGVPDGKVPRETMMRHISEIAVSTSLPVSADLGDGFGREPETVAESIRLAAAAGAVGCSIEDSTGDPASPLLPLALAAERISAAVEAARSLPFPFIVTARAENYFVGHADLEDVLTRFERYREAGADVLYAPLLPDADAIAAAVERAAPCPVNVLAEGRGVASCADALACLGVRRISLGSGLSRVAFSSIIAAIGHLKHGDFKFLSRSISLSGLNAHFARCPKDR
jgi:2-methylisocitrate lyase-like PEP mutase family enzyme